MTPELVATIAGCALVGYAIVTWLLNRLSGTTRPSARPEDQPKEEPPKQERPPPPPPPPPWHKVLEVAENASEEKIKAAYWAKIRMYHPDRVAGLGPEFQSLAETRAQGINAAYQDGLKTARRRR